MMAYRNFTVRETHCMRSFNNHSTHKRLGLRRLLDTTWDVLGNPYTKATG